MVDKKVSLDVMADNAAEAHGGCASCGSGKAGEGLSSCGNGLEKIYPTTAVRFGYMRFIGEFTHAPEMKFTCGAKVVIQTQRGIELGEQVALTCDGCDKSVTREQMKQWVADCGEDSYMFKAGRILREATAADLAELARIQQGCTAKRVFAQQVATKHKLAIRVVECECPLGGERVIFYFNAAERVDFRGMVRDLADEYRTRIEMRQIGARDEARLLADYETCGREVCCKSFLKTLKPISMRMAKLQKATLDPSQVSGRCGRLKCCLRYEHMGYEELNKKLPRNGVRIRTDQGEGVIVNRQILTQLVQIQKDDGSLVTVVIEDVTAVDVPKPTQPPKEETKAEAQRGGRRSPETAGRGGAKRRPARPRPERTDASRPPRQTTSDASGESRNGTSAEKSSESDGRKRRRRRRRRRDNRRGGGPSSPPDAPPGG